MSPPKRNRLSAGCYIYFQKHSPGATQLSQSTTDTGRVRSPKPSPVKVESNRNICQKHQQSHCPSCVFHLDPEKGVWEDAEIIKDRKVDLPESWATQPLFGDQARFNAADYSQAGLYLYRPKKGAISETQDLVKYKPPQRDTNPAPEKSWFVYCPQCQLSYLVGSEGPDEAANHPAHLAQAETQKRTIAVFINGEGEQITTNKDNDNGGPRWNSRFSVYYGPGSRYNGGGTTHGYKDESHLLYMALSNALANFADQVPRRRRREIQNRYAVTNSHRFLRDYSVFRLLVLVGPGLHQFMPLIGPTAARDYMDTEALLAAQDVRWRWNAARVKAKESIADEVRNLAGMGIQVEWYEYEGSSCPLP
ncbi:hypothetical protein PG999_011770 [Apiospora kogelbergensis]|uniref:Uncharacterized protein n=1 Tax=Apiospora kogelbergensis TaxID=1337665 RepID=A0AAW0QI40_9PEZI